MGECFNCSRRGSGSYSLLFESGHRIEDREFCRQCRAFFEASAHMEVLEAPVLLRGGGAADEDADEE